MADPMSLLMLARDNKAGDLKAAIAMGISPNFGNQVIHVSLKCITFGG